MQGLASNTDLNVDIIHRVLYIYFDTLTVTLQINLKPPLIKNTLIMKLMINISPYLIEH